ncbi:outer membrane protein assembly factor [Sodalis ligni]|uniref:Translocation and assembly module subunit TamA n=1 Tax=Sodalis ligni TaxID=2697027 RepID=A0A4R1NHA9_9GAMM|nr:autotransporter assembly complex family protein [Sodalis ligni]QWA10251.1 outer membrane protein assembly factor [Sodalis ligni]TCL06379.1 autotransporter secretion outer membrane protein TamA [Sodalis ligni]
MLKNRLICLVCILAATPGSNAANVRLQVDGLKGELQRNVRVRLSTIGADEITADARFQARVDSAIREGLRALGYYEPKIDFTFRPAVKGGRPVLVAAVSPGPPVKIAAATIILRGDARRDASYQRLVQRSRPAVGTVLNHGDYTAFIDGMTGLAVRNGYFDAEFLKRQLAVSPARREAFWNVDFDSGQRYRFGEIRFHGSQIRTDYLQNIPSIHPGDEYSATALAELNRQLSATNWFNSVVVSPDLVAGKKSKVLPLDAVVTPRSRNIIETGAGFASDIGPRVRTTWNRPWLNSMGHSFQTGLSLSAPEQALDFSYKIPVQRSPLEQYYLLQSGFKREDLNDTKSDSTTLNVARFWDFSTGWQRSVNLRWSLDHFTQANVTDTTMLIYPGFTINRTRQRGGAMPTWGDSQRYSLDVSDTAWGSDIDFFILQAQNVWVRTLEEKHRFVARYNLGWIETNNFERVPPSLRFFAGGDRSIRGYRFRSISPRDADGKLIGASQTATGSLEYQYNVTGRWWGAAFIDSGQAVNDIRHTNLKTGAGIGVRWQSPVGPIKLDIATPVGDPDNHSVQFYIGLGTEL